VLLPEDDEDIGPVQVAAIRRPLAAPILHSRVGEIPARRIRYLVEQGIVQIDGRIVNFTSGILLDDLAGALRSNNRLERRDAGRSA